MKTLERTEAIPYESQDKRIYTVRDGINLE